MLAEAALRGTIWAIVKKHASGFPMGVVAFYSSSSNAKKALQRCYGDSRVQRERRRIDHEYYAVRKYSLDEARELARQGAVPTTVHAEADCP